MPPPPCVNHPPRFPIRYIWESGSSCGEFRLQKRIAEFRLLLEVFCFGFMVRAPREQ